MSWGDTRQSLAKRRYSSRALGTAPVDQATNTQRGNYATSFEICHLKELEGQLRVLRTSLATFIERKLSRLKAVLIETRRT